jgi:hypothetical protein
LSFLGRHTDGFPHPVRAASGDLPRVGAEASHTTRVVLDLQADHPPVVTQTQYATPDQEEALIRVFEATGFVERT